MLNMVQEFLTPEVITTLTRVALIAVAIYIVHKFVIDRIVERLIRKLIPSEKFELEEEEKQREDTIIEVTLTTMHILLWVLGGMIILSELGLNIGPLIAAAGIGGLALGFGGQYLIRDVINGLFVLLENQYSMGDVVCFGDTCGLVEDVNLRRTIVRDLDGTVHNIPNGEIGIASNMSHKFARVNLDIGVGYGSNLEHVIHVVNEVGNELANDAEWKDKIKTAPQFLRVKEFSDSAIVIKILGETKPLEQWGVTGELRKRLKIAFDKEGIEIPFPQRVIHKPKEE